jgi:hypothetical protein
MRTVEAFELLLGGFSIRKRLSLFWTSVPLYIYVKLENSEYVSSASAGHWTQP